MTSVNRRFLVRLIHITCLISCFVFSSIASAKKIKGDLGDSNSCYVEINGETQIFKCSDKNVSCDIPNGTCEVTIDGQRFGGNTNPHTQIQMPYFELEE